MIRLETILVVVNLAAVSSSNFTATSATDCLDTPLDRGVMEWQDTLRGSSILVEWGFGNDTCATMNGCFGLSLEENIPLAAQLPPIITQPGVLIKFVASGSLDQPFKVRPRKVSIEAFKQCDVTSGVPVVAEFTSEPFTVPNELLQIGSNYFIAETTDLLYRCQTGFRLNITIKEERCRGVGESAKCWNKGRCLSDFYQSAFACSCCEGYSGEYCQETNSCHGNLCHNNATCVTRTANNGTSVICVCPPGYLGDYCEMEVENMCEMNQCENNGTCTGSRDNYTCACAHGFEGHHCEIDVNDCASEPCGHGICVDKTAGHQCYCTPGYTGESCAMMLPHCDENHCKNTGVCVENELGVSCHCPRGYSGIDCSVKVDLCNPSPCVNAIECVDYGHSLSCTCRPGYTGERCEIDINECMSNPCHNGGHCIDMESSFRCMCPRGIHGAFCNIDKQPIVEEQDYEGLPYNSPWRHRTPAQNLAIIAGTLGGGVLLALVILLGCYCKVHETYKKFYCSRTAVTKGYKRQVDDDTRQRIASSSLSEPRLSADAIFEATSSDYSRNSLNAPLKSSLKPKKV